MPYRAKSQVYMVKSLKFMHGTKTMTFIVKMMDFLYENNFIQPIQG